MKKILKWGIIATVVLIVIMAVVGSSDSDQKQGDVSQNSSRDKQQEQVITTYQVGDVINAGNAEVIVTNVEERSSVGSQYISEKASEGGTLVAVTWKYKNIGNKPIPSYKTPSIKLIGPDGIEYDSDLGKSSVYATEMDIDSKVLSDLNPGITVKDAKVFEISKEAYTKNGWKLQVNVNGKTYLVKVK